MIHSMTGYGKAVVTYNDKKIGVEVKSLNSKSMDLSVRMAAAYREHEMEVRQRVAKALERGKVDLNVWVEQDGGASAATINAAVVENYHQQISALAEKMGLAEPQDWFSLLLRMPDATAKCEQEAIDEAEWTAVSGAIDEAIERLQDFRRQEGEALERKFSEKIDNISALLKQIEPYEKSRVEKIRARIVDALEAIPEVEYDKNRLEQELIYYIEKLDISEEKQRLSNHLEYFRKTMQGPVGQGKTLGFIAQEMGREINTTGSKSNNAEMQNIVVRMKDELEQIKEQVLNAL